MWVSLRVRSGRLPRREACASRDYVFLRFFFLFLLGDAGTQSLFKYVRIFRVCSIRACIRGYNCNYMEATFKEGVPSVHIPYSVHTCI